MPKAFSEQEKIRIRAALIESCKINWAAQGYLRTSIDDLCRKAGISRGTFYNFFPSKEQLFFETTKEIQQELSETVALELQKNPCKEGMASAIKILYNRHITAPALFDTTSADFFSFYNKLSDEQKGSLDDNGLHQALRAITLPGLKLRINEEKALAVMVTLLGISAFHNQQAYNGYEIFDFFVDNLIDKIYE